MTMGEYKRVHFQKIDFSLPVQRFRIEYALVRKTDLSFVREFVLRLLNITELRVAELAGFLGFTAKEAKVAIADLLNSDEVVYKEDGSIGLTGKSKKYFEVSPDSRPRVSEIVEDRGTFCFDIIAFNYIGRNPKYEHWSLSLKLNIDAETRANSQEHAKKAFERSFYEIYEKGDIRNTDKNSEERVDIYKISDVTKQREQPHRITQDFFMDVESHAVERSELRGLGDQDQIIAEITASLERNRQGENIDSIAKAAQTFDDQVTLAALNKNGLDLAGLLIEQVRAKEKETKRKPIIGSLSLEQNWGDVERLVSKAKASFEKENEVGKQTLLWLAPTNAFWGKSKQLSERVRTLINLGQVGGSPDKQIFETRIILPMSDENDRRTKNYWLGELREYQAHLYGCVGGFLAGGVEVLCFPRQFAYVVYHLVPPGQVLPLPFGFWTDDVDLVRAIEREVSNYLSQYTEDMKQRYLGKLSV